MNCHGWQFGLICFFGGLVVGCIGILLWDAYRGLKALHVLRQDILRDSPPAFRGKRYD